MATPDEIMDFDTGNHTVVCNSLWEVVVMFQTVQIQFVNLLLLHNLLNNYTVEAAVKIPLFPQELVLKSHHKMPIFPIFSKINIEWS